MKAMLLMGHGGPEMMKFGDAPDPKAGPGEVVVDIHAASVNGADPKVRRGKGRYKLDQFPHILGRDFSGVVSEVGAGVTDFKVGDAVFGVTDVGIEGAYAEKIAIKAAIVAKKPASLSHAEAAALGLISLTALTAIEDTAAPQSGRDHPDPGRRRRRRRIRRATRQAYRRDGDLDRQRRQSRLCARPRRRPRHRLQQRGFHQHRPGLRRGVRHCRRRRSRRLLQGAQAGRQTGMDRAGAGGL